MGRTKAALVSASSQLYSHLGALTFVFFGDSPTRTLAADLNDSLRSISILDGGAAGGGWGLGGAAGPALGPVEVPEDTVRGISLLTRGVPLGVGQQSVT